MSKLNKRKSIVLVGKRIPTAYEIQKETTLKAKEVLEKTKEMEHIKNKPIKYLLK
ncbi:hypothetical protein HWC92_gp35 [Flavobacterium phage vB_FspS_morran9-1]|jgi:hypothetical protein|uniref:Uncharacterized protein n=10 Tax=Lillamyvirus TaxID=2843418 RepID=A0A6B9LAQ2_9CAUD|nr:hypothetical protein HWC91_gp36 [Flavobacterium phage vB_FspS_lillamy9-1]YP_009854963.1 hypothetical protein HWC92_gp35 [Flavobacterium phage vB_FspS_morran9-1]YP_009855172.1 hypothetical protein HWC95_gp36 [Flavobacterium phage vB_FspS_sniff9-1]QHB39137.1 hypothetical protein lillamy92_gp036 [Flavobacterium phage vB_FspS_lillamy9-2]QHB39210.1 hypothetical protein lillamy93_gp036 [Flavobacterium phage vB_FspS_lillamy9-3]QHB39283.1 hypothetical protein lillamy94_gp036 [Flavobacterium phage v